ncbi:YoaK family protein [Actimicrobium sp. GrIS 1.19]|uniref:YoaK family protein n=1 Tax=Actimicrobium sp. GrIS 1.19 TaxID=3071708 RepID=UPI002E106781
MPIDTPAPVTPAKGPDQATGSALDAALLSYVAAFVDTAGFVGLFGLFTAHVTGNFVLMGAQLVNHNGEVIAKLLSLPVFVLAVALSVLLANWLKRRARSALTPLLGVQAGLLLAAALIAMRTGAPVSADDINAIAIGTTMIAAMGLQNALMRLELGAMPPTTVMTGNVTQATIDVMQLWTTSANASERAVQRKRLQKMWPSMLAFLLGAASGALGYLLFGFWCLLVPSALCAVLAGKLGRRSLSGGPA